jgi:rod shape-determining protein MreD
VKQGLWHHLDLIAHNLSPFAITALLVMAGVVPLGLPDLAPIFPALALIAVYYWAVHRPDLMPVWAVFLIGLFQDLLNGGPLGVGVIALLVVHAMVGSLRRYFVGASLPVLWLLAAHLCPAGHLAGSGTGRLPVPGDHGGLSLPGLALRPGATGFPPLTRARERRRRPWP